MRRRDFVRALGAGSAAAVAGLLPGAERSATAAPPTIPPPRNRAPHRYGPLIDDGLRLVSCTPTTPTPAWIRSPTMADGSPGSGALRGAPR